MNDGKGARSAGPSVTATESPDPAVPRTGPGAAAADGADPGLDRPTQGRIGDQLRAMYDDLLNQPVPDRFVDLLKKLDGNSAA